MSAETASHYLTGADIGVLPFNHGHPQEWFTPSSAHALPVVATRHTVSLPDGHPVQLVSSDDALAAGLLGC